MAKRGERKQERREVTWIGGVVPLSIQGEDVPDDAVAVAWLNRQEEVALAADLVPKGRATTHLVEMYGELASELGEPTHVQVAERDQEAGLREVVARGVRIEVGLDREGASLLEAVADEIEFRLEEEHLGPPVLAGGEAVYQLEVTLADVEPRIWRRIRVTEDLSLADLHVVLQETMGWEDCHLHEFVIDKRRYGMLDPEAPAELNDENDVRIGDVLSEGMRFRYEYDFGDGWEHEIAVEKVGRAAAGDRVAACLAGERACPPEDCGGPGGYEDLLEALANADDEEHAERLEWVDEDFDPEEFDLDAVNSMLDELLLEDDEDSDDSLELMNGIECAYEASRDPDPAEWLALDEDERQVHALLHHVRLDEPHPAMANAQLHATLHVVVEDQIALGQPPETGVTLARLRAEGLPRHEAIHAIGSVFARMAWGASRGEACDADAYVAELTRLNATDWSGGGAE